MKEKIKQILNKYRKHIDFDGFNIEGPNDTGAGGEETVFIVACRMGELEDVKIFLEHGADPNLAGDIGNTPLHNAVMSKSVNIIKILLDNDADPLIENEFGETPADYARMKNLTEIAELLDKKSNF